MRYIGLLAVVAIIYITYARMIAPTPAQKPDKTDITQPLDAANPDHPTAAGATLFSLRPDRYALKAPLDRTREVLGLYEEAKIGGSILTKKEPPGNFSV